MKHFQYPVSHVIQDALIILLAGPPDADRCPASRMSEPRSLGPDPNLAIRLCVCEFLTQRREQFWKCIKANSARKRGWRNLGTFPRRGPPSAPDTGTATKTWILPSWGD